jgi:hypothetical protein
MSTNKRQFTMRMQDETYEKVRYIAFIERRSIAMEIEHIILRFVKEFEENHGEIAVQG